MVQGTLCSTVVCHVYSNRSSDAYLSSPAVSWLLRILSRYGSRGGADRHRQHYPSVTHPNFAIQHYRFLSLQPSIDNVYIDF